MFPQKTLFILLGAVTFAFSVSFVEGQDLMTRLNSDCGEEPIVLGVSYCFVYYCYEGKKRVFYISSDDGSSQASSQELCQEEESIDKPCQFDEYDSIPSRFILERVGQGPGCGLRVCMNGKIVFYNMACGSDTVMYDTKMKRTNLLKKIKKDQ